MRKPGGLRPVAELLNRCAPEIFSRGVFPVMCRGRHPRAGFLEDVPDSGTPALVASIHNNTIRAMRTLPDIEDLRKRKQTQLDELDKELAAEKARYTM